MTWRSVDAGGERMPTRHLAVSSLAVVVVALLGCYLLLPASGARTVIWVVAALGGAVVALVHSMRTKLADPLPVWLLAAGIALIGAGQALAVRTPDIPSYGDVLRLAAYPVAAAAVIAFQRDRVRRDRASLLDSLVVTVAAAQAGWLVIVEPALHHGDLAVVITNVAYPLGDLLVIGVIARLTFSVLGSHDVAARYLVGGLGLGVLSDVSATVAHRDGLAAGWLPAFALVCLAVRHPGMASPPEHPADARLASAWRFVVLLGLACLVSPVLVITHPVGEEHEKAAVVLGGAVLLFTLSVMRIVSLLDRLRRAFRREHVLRGATASLVGAADRGAVRDAALSAAADLLDQAGSRAWRVDSDPGGTVAQATDDGDIATFLDAAELALFPDGPSGIGVLNEPSLLHATLGVPTTQCLVLIALPVRGMAREAAVVSVPTPPSTRTTSALESLASTMSMALERLDVGEIMVERRSERRLRIMLQYASDVICILDHDLTVVHVTPAVEPIVGLPAPELLGMNWLDVVAEDDREAARDLVTLAQGGRPARGEIRLNTEGGSARHVDAVVTEVIDEDLMGFVVTCHDITERHELEQQLTHQAFHDALTGLANRALFRDRLGHAMARSRGTARYGVLFVDLDDFKTVNDSLGHAAGDTLLREMTTRLRDCLRDGDTAARLGGDEFAILLEDVEDDEHCERIARRLLEALRVPFDVGGTEVGTSASIGIAIGSPGPSTPEDLMRNADLALYDAKNAGKNRYAVFAVEMHEAAIARLSLTSDLRHAIESGELVVHYQPLVALDSGEITGLEALVRWNHPRRGVLQPGQFIPLAEETGLIVPLGRAVLRAALHATVIWQRGHEAHRDLRIAVNVSGRQLQDPGIVEDVRTAIEDTKIDPSTVVLEITESVLLPGEDVVIERLHALADLGVHLYIDDFGTGYSSLSYLQMLPVDGLKLAQEFVETLPGTESQSGMVRTIRDLADTLGLAAVVAEGIERPEQWTSLLSLGYRLGQGFHLALPMPADQIPGFLDGSSPLGEIEPGQGAAAAAASSGGAETSPV
jgi:diguanylate cyclase (GGDEF)-like protein/PAS domain S-box-containing protein